MKLNKFSKILATLMILLMGQIVIASVATEAQVQYNKGLDYYKAGQLEDSARCFRQAIELNPNYIDAYYNLGSIMEYLNDDEQALNAFKQIILRKPDDYDSVYKAAEISHRLGQDEKAKMYLTLIPIDTLVGQKAKQLSDEIESSSVLQQSSEEEQKAKQAILLPEIEDRTPTKAQEESNNFTYENISSPTGIVSDSRGNLYVADFADNLIYKIGQDNNKIVFIKNSKIDGPIGMAMDRNDNIYIANYNKDNVIKVDSNGAISEFITKVQKPYCMYISGNYLFVSSQGSNSVIRHRLSE